MLRPSPLQQPHLSLSSISPQLKPYPPFPTFLPSIQTHPKPFLRIAAKSTRSERIKKTTNLQIQIEEDGADSEIDTNFDEDEEELTPRGRFRGRGEEERDYDRDPEFAEIIGSCLDDPQKARSKMEERLRKKRNKILHTKTGSATPMKVIFNKFDFSNSYIWFEFYNAPLEKDVSLICDAIRSWHIVGRLGGCNSLNICRNLLWTKGQLMMPFKEQTLLQLHSITLGILRFKINWDRSICSKHL